MRTWEPMYGPPYRSKQDMALGTHGRIEEDFEDMSGWEKKHPGNNEYTCIWCGIYRAGKAR